MARVVCVHGISQEYESRETLLKEWAPAVCGGVSNAGGHLSISDVDMAFYGAMFRPPGQKKAGFQIPPFKPGDLTDPFEEALLENIFDNIETSTTTKEATKTDFGRRTVAQMLRMVANTPYFGRKAQNLVIWFLKQVHRYVSETTVRRSAQEALMTAITSDTHVIIGHSLGSIVAYEVLCERTDLKVDTLITIGSPLGLPALLSRLLPPADKGGKWPGQIRHWVNIADSADIVALARNLRPIYGNEVVDLLVHNGATMHDAKPYLTARETGGAVLSGLSKKARE
jgi:hypothetical protein